MFFWVIDLFIIKKYGKLKKNSQYFNIKKISDIEDLSFLAGDASDRKYFLAKYLQKSSDYV